MSLVALVPGCHPLDALPDGPPPRAPYVAAGTVHEPGGTTTPLPGQRRLGVTGLTPHAGGWLVADAQTFEGSLGLAQVDGRHRERLGPCVGGAGAVPSHDRTQVAWVTQGCPEAYVVAPTLVHVAEEDGGDEVTVELERQGLLWVVGFVDDAVVVTGYAEPVRLVARDGSVRRLPPLRSATSTSSRGLVAGRLGLEAPAAAVDARTGAVVWERPGIAPGPFSPDGERLLAWAGPRLLVLDARTGATLRTLALPRPSYDVAWEDDRHVLAVVARRGREVVVRVGPGGRVSAVTPVRAPGTYALATGP